MNKTIRTRGVEAGSAEPPSGGPPGTPPADAEEFGEECGGKGGVPYRIFALPPERLTRITVWHREVVDGIQLETGRGVLPMIGGTGRHRDVQRSSFELEPAEFLIAVTIEYWSVIDRIGFQTNKRSLGPYGGHGGRIKKTLSVPTGKIIVGFKGRHWDFVDSLQLLTAPA